MITGDENLNDILVLSRPDVIRSIHASFPEVGCDVIESILADNPS
jgi:5-methyltetrahydrofolate--homocysteine methyltransferase